MKTKRQGKSVDVSVTCRDVTAERVRSALMATADHDVRVKAAGVIWWDLCEGRPDYAAAAAPFREVYPGGAVSRSGLFRVLRAAGYSVKAAAIRSVAVEKTGCKLDANRLLPTGFSRSRGIALGTESRS